MINESEFKRNLNDYLSDVEKLSTESSLSHRFAMFLQQNFEKETDFVSNYTAGIEKTLKVKKGGMVLRGRADNLFGNLVIEFKLSNSDIVEAMEQLQLYLAILWSNESGKDRLPYLAIATDGVRFYSFSPTLKDPSIDSPDPEDIELNQIEEFDWSECKPTEVWYWLDRYLLRQQPQLPRTDTIVRDFGIGSHAFKTVTSSLISCWRKVQNVPCFEVIYDSWEKYLRIVYGASVGADELFIRHTYLATLAKLMSWIRVSESNHTPKESEIIEILEGEYFKSQGIENFIEEDFFSWIVRHQVRRDGVRAVRWLLSLLQKYNLHQLSEDVLKSLYQELVDPETRKYLGEFYTPDWLAAKIIDNVLTVNAKGSMLDPSCGSGTFLYLGIRRKRELLKDTNKTLEHILNSVCGIDIHPLAVIIAKTNYILALGELLQKRRKESISIPVYLSDSIRLPERGQMSTSHQIPTYSVQLETQQVFVPEELVEDYSLYDKTIELARSFAIRFKNKNAELSVFREFLKNNGFSKANVNELVKAIFDIALVLKHFIDSDRDSIWSFVLKNIYKPLFLKKQFDFIVGNPPWLTYNQMDKGYQESLSELIRKDYKLVPGRSELLTHLEVATLFLLRTADFYLKQGGRIAFVLPRSIFAAEQHENLRRRTFLFSEDTTSTLDWEQVWDFKDVKPLFKIPCCVLIGQKVDVSKAPKGIIYKIPVAIYHGHFPSRNLKLSEAVKYLKHSNDVLTTHTRGHRFFWDTGVATVKTDRSYYAPFVQKGANLVPRCCWFVDVKPSRLGYNSECPKVETEKHASETAKLKGIRMQGKIESDFLYGTLTGSEILPFGHLGMRTVIVPIQLQGNNVELLDPIKAENRGFFDLARWLENADEAWKAKRKNKANQNTICDWINYQNKLVRQHPTASYRVVYNANGANVSATVIGRNSTVRSDQNEIQLRGFIAEDELGLFETNDKHEAYYLAAVLNSTIISELIKPMQSCGDFGPRHIHKKVFELPIPRFNPDNKKHQQLSALGEKASRRVSKWVSSTDGIEERSIASIRKNVKSMMQNELAEVNQLVQGILPS